MEWKIPSLLPSAAVIDLDVIVPTALSMENPLSVEFPTTSAVGNGG